MVNLMNNYLYLKGTCNVVVRDIANGDVKYQGTKVQTNQMQTTCDMGAIQAGIGNTTVINIPHNCALNLNLVAADFNMNVRAMNVGTNVAYNGVAPVCEVVTANGTQLTVTKTAAAPFGYQTAICNVVEAGATNASGETYTIDENKNVVGFTATAGKNYTVTYFAQEASAEYFNVSSVFAPGIYHVTTQMAVYSATGAANAMNGTHVGDLYIIVPRMQFSGKADVTGDQTTAGTTDLSGTALTYDEAAAQGVCADCAASKLAQVLYVPLTGSTASVKGLAVIGGGMTLAKDAQLAIPFMYVMPDNTLYQPDYSECTYSIPSDGQQYATVSDAGVVSGVAAGDTEVTVTLKSNTAIKTTATVTVTAS